ncbi:homologous recombination OB-fold protein [Rhynochetos jubatus]
MRVRGHPGDPHIGVCGHPRDPQSGSVVTLGFVVTPGTPIRVRRHPRDPHTEGPPSGFVVTLGTPLSGSVVTLGVTVYPHAGVHSHPGDPHQGLCSPRGPPPGPTVTPGTPPPGGGDPTLCLSFPLQWVDAGGGAGGDTPGHPAPRPPSRAVTPTRALTSHAPPVAPRGGDTPGGPRVPPAAPPPPPPRTDAAARRAGGSDPRRARGRVPSIARAPGTCAPRAPAAPRAPRRPSIFAAGPRPPRQQHSHTRVSVYVLCVRTVCVWWHTRQSARVHVCVRTCDGWCATARVCEYVCAGCCGVAHTFAHTRVTGGVQRALRAAQAGACADESRRAGAARREGFSGAAPAPPGAAGSRPGPAHFRLGGLGRAAAMACRLQKLFGADGDLADEDFLSAVEDAENRFAVPGRVSPGAAPLPRSPQPLRPLAPQLGHRPGNPPALRPLAGRGEHPAGCRGPPAPGAAPQDELDNDLFLAACMELEGPEVPAGAGAAPGQWEKPPGMSVGQETPQERAPPKKPRVGEELVPPGSEGPEDRQDPLPTPPPAPAPKLVLRPSTAGACPPRPPTPLGKPGGSWGSVPPPGPPSPRPFQASPCQPGASSSSAGLRMPRAPRQSCPPPRLPPRLPPNPPALLSCVEPPGRQPARPAPGSLQTPVVTNHLVQLVTAASKAPGAAPRLPLHRKARRFPGPAGILPQQHAGKLPEEILISAPQTPAHGAVAKLRTEGLSCSAPPVEEDFGKGPWLAMKRELELDERDPGCFLRTYSVVMVLRKAALKQLPKNKVPSMAVMIKTLTRTNVDAGAVFRDPTGEMQGTLHRLLLEERQGELRPGSVLLLKQVGVFSPSHRNHYLNVTPNNLLKVYPPEPEGSLSQPSPEQREVPAQAEPLRDHPARPPRGVPAPGAGGRQRTGSPTAEQSPGGSSLRPQSPGPRREEPVGGDGCDMDDLDGLLGELPEDFFSAPAQADCR